MSRRQLLDPGCRGLRIHSKTCAEPQTSATTFATMALLPDARTKFDPSRKYLALCWNGKKDVRAEKLPKPCVTDPVSSRSYLLLGSLFYVVEVSKASGQVGCMHSGIGSLCPPRPSLERPRATARAMLEL